MKIKKVVISILIFIVVMLLSDFVNAENFQSTTVFENSNNYCIEAGQSFTSGNFTETRFSYNESRK